jgi:hypothetical protein
MLILELYSTKKIEYRATLNSVNYQWGLQPYYLTLNIFFVSTSKPLQSNTLWDSKLIITINKHK